MRTRRNVQEGTGAWLGRHVVLGICLAATLVAAIIARADDEFFRNLREDLTVPEKCRETQIGFFQLRGLQTMLYGISGARDRGFTDEYPIERQEAAELWEILKPPKVDGSGHSRVDKRKDLPRNKHRLVDYLNVIDAYRDKMGFDFGSEGEVLEILAIVALKEKFPDSEYFVTGSIEYHESGESRTIGELDLVVGRNADCRVEWVGEAKLGVHMSGKARSQLARFRSFLENHERLLRWHGLDGWPGLDQTQQEFPFAH